jgi:hypothetical protein
MNKLNGTIGCSPESDCRKQPPVTASGNRTTRYYIPGDSIPVSKVHGLGKPFAGSYEHGAFVVDKAALGQVFSEYFGFPCQSSFHQFLHHHNYPGLVQ